jgi:hypothetical protein
MVETTMKKFYVLMLLMLAWGLTGCPKGDDTADSTDATAK